MEWMRKFRDGARRIKQRTVAAGRKGLLPRLRYQSYLEWKRMTFPLILSLLSHNLTNCKCYAYRSVCPLGYTRLLRYQHFFCYCNFANHETKELFVLTANRSLVGTFINNKWRIAIALQAYPRSVLWKWNGNIERNCWESQLSRG